MSLDQPTTLFEKTWDRLEAVFKPLLSVLDPNPPRAKALEPPETTRTNREINWIAVGVEVTLRLAITVTAGLLISALSRKLLGDINSDADASPPPETVRSRLERILRKRHEGNEKIALPSLSSYELQMAEDIIDPDDIETSFADIGGLDDTKREIYELAVLPLVQPELFTGKLVQPTKGILLFGKPGTGKTMLARALAKEAEAVFLPLQLSKVLNKWVGESNKLVAATFSLAQKLQPSIIFIDELDTFLKANNSESSAFMDTVKAEFLTWWDGVATSETARIMVLGATNKPHAIDAAILRRMPRAFAVPLPDAPGRLVILKLLLQDEHVETAVMEEFLPELAQSMTVGYSGSDLKELCKAAAMVPVQERTAEFARRRVMGERISKQQTKDGLSKAPLRAIGKDDLVLALSKVKRSGSVAMEYGREEMREELVELRKAAEIANGS